MTPPSAADFWAKSRNDRAFALRPKSDSVRHRPGFVGLWAYDQEAADVAKAIAHPTRLTMVRMLQDSEDGLSATVFGKKCPGHGTLSKLSYHMTELKKAGLTTTEPAPGARGWKRNLHRGDQGLLGAMCMASKPASAPPKAKRGSRRNRRPVGNTPRQNSLNREVWLGFIEKVMVESGGTAGDPTLFNGRRLEESHQRSLHRWQTAQRSRTRSTAERGSDWWGRCTPPGPNGRRRRSPGSPRCRARSNA
jgi:hypothetical protein